MLNVCIYSALKAEIFILIKTKAIRTFRVGHELLVARGVGTFASINVEIANP